VYDTTQGEALRFAGGSLESMTRAMERSDDAALKQAEEAKLAKVRQAYTAYRAECSKAKMRQNVEDFLRKHLPSKFIVLHSGPTTRARPSARSPLIASCGRFAISWELPRRWTSTPITTSRIRPGQQRRRSSRPAARGSSGRWLSATAKPRGCRCRGHGGHGAASAPTVAGVPPQGA
jgi:hypothetical protein